MAEESKTSGNKPLVYLSPQTGKVPGHSGALEKREEIVMTKNLRRWRSDRRYRSTLRALQSLSERQLCELGIRPFEIQHLAREASRLG